MGYNKEVSDIDEVFGRITNILDEMIEVQKAMLRKLMYEEESEALIEKIYGHLDK